MSEAPRGQALPPQSHQEHWQSGADIAEKEQEFVKDPSAGLTSQIENKAYPKDLDKKGK